MQEPSARVLSSGYFDQTFLHPLGAAALLVLGLLTLVLPRRHAILPLLFLVSFIPSSQRIALAGLDFSLLRILVICGGLRLIQKKEFDDVRWNSLDKVLLAWAALEAVGHILQRGSSGAVVYMSGKMLEYLGLYFVSRGFIRSIADVRRIAVALAVMAIPSAIFFVIEKQTGRNWFSIFGGVAEWTMIREGELRATGALAHPILAGSYWAASAALIAALWWYGKRALAVIGVVCSFLIILACSSSTPLGGLLAGALGVAIFPLRRNMRELRWGIVILLLGLEVVMSRHVWHLLTRIDLVGGSTGWHRYTLIDAWIRHAPEWFLVGIRGTGHWGRGLRDITSQYVYHSVLGGFGSLALFIAQISIAFSFVGRAWRAHAADRAATVMCWALGVALWIHCVQFIAVTYFGQVHFSFYMILGSLGSLAGGWKTAVAPQGALVATQTPHDRRKPVPNRQRRLLGEPG